MNRRGFIKGLLAAPAVITTPGLLTPVKPVWTPALPWGIVHHDTHMIYPGVTDDIRHFYGLKEIPEEVQAKTFYYEA